MKQNLQNPDMNSITIMSAGNNSELMKNVENSASKAQSSRTKAVPTELMETINLIIWDISKSSTKSSVKHYFEQFGTVICAKILPHRHPDEPLRAYVVLQNCDENFLSTQEHIIDSKKVVIDVRKTDTFPGASRSLMLNTYCQNQNVFKCEDIAQYFAQYGTVMNLVEPRNNQLRSGYKFAFLKFKEYKFADQCLAESPHTIETVHGTISVFLKPGKDY